MAKVTTRRRTWVLILLCATVLSTGALTCHAQEPGKLPDAKSPSLEPAPAFVPEIKTNSVVPEPAKVKPDKKPPEKSWLRRLFEGTLTGAARYNTDKQSEGRPAPQINSR